MGAPVAQARRHRSAHTCRRAAGATCRGRGPPGQAAPLRARHVRAGAIRRGDAARMLQDDSLVRVRVVGKYASRVPETLVARAS